MSARYQGNVDQSSFAISDGIEFHEYANKVQKCSQQTTNRINVGLLARVAQNFCNVLISFKISAKPT